MTNYSGAIAAFLQSKGLNPIATAGGMGNISVETGGTYDPTSYNPHENAIGFAQWELDRRTRLQQYARETGSSETNPTTQLNFMWQELESRGLVSQLNAASTPAEAATIWDTQFEGSAGTTRQERIHAANTWYKTGSHLGPTGAPTQNLVGVPPYPATTLKEPLSNTQRNRIIDYIAKQHGKPGSAEYTAKVKELQALKGTGHAGSDGNHIIYITYIGMITNSLPKADPGAVTAGIGPLPGMSDLFGGLKTILTFLTSAKNWERIGLFVLGAFLLILAAVKMLGVRTPIGVV